MKFVNVLCAPNFRECFLSAHERTCEIYQFEQIKEDMPEISIEEVEYAVSKMKNNREPEGPSMVIDTIKLERLILKSKIKILFNLCLDQNTQYMQTSPTPKIMFPSAW